LNDLDHNAAERTDSAHPWNELLLLAQSGDETALINHHNEMSTTDQAYLIAHLEEYEVELVLQALSPEYAAELIGNLSEAQAAGALAVLRPDSAAAIIKELASDEQADILGELAEDQADAILQYMTREEAAAVRELTAYDDDVAGGLMNREMLKIPLRSTVGEVIKLIGETLETVSDDDILYGYVTDSADKLVGVLPMHNLLFVNRAATVAETMIKDPKTVLDTASLPELAEIFDSHSFLGIPIVNSSGQLCGVVHRESVNIAEGQAADSDYLKSQGIVGGEELRSMRVWLRSKRRLSWLSVNILLNIGAASVIAIYQETLQTVIALAIFLPIISDMSGCSGNQAVAVSMRELSLGLVRPREVLRVWMQEFKVGLINGFVLGVLVALAAYIYNGNAWLGFVVGIALFINTIIAVSIGGTVPLIVKRFGFDPAIASGPLLTTITDMCGFFLVLGIASQMLDKLA